MSKTKFSDDARLHKLCHDGKMKSIEAYVKDMDSQTLEQTLSSRKGVFGYTPLHEAVASGRPNVIKFLLERVGDTRSGCVNCRANSGYTPLHLAASTGIRECVRVLLDYDADVSCVDEYGKNPTQTAELSSKNSIMKTLRSEGE